MDSVFYFRKGISPIVAAVLLIGFTMAVASLVGPFFSDVLQSSQTGVSEDTRDVVSAAGSSLEVESAVFNGSGGENVSGVVRNSGQEELENFTVTVYGDSPRQVELDESLDSGEVTSFEVDGVSNPDRVAVSSRNLPVKAEKEVESSVDSGSSSGGSVYGTVSASPGWEDVKVEAIDSNNNVVGSDMTNSSGEYNIDLSSSDSYTVRAAGVNVSESIAGDTNITFDLKGEVLKGGQTVKNFNSVTETGCSFNGSNIDMSYPVIDGSRKVTVPKQLQCIKKNLSTDYELTQDIDLSETSNWNNGDGFEPMGDANNKFKGNLNGKGHELSGLYLTNKTNNYYVGMFEDLGDSKIENLYIDGEIDAASESRVGLVAGRGVGSPTLKNIEVDGNITCDNSCGVLVGDYQHSGLDNGTIKNITLNSWINITGSGSGSGGLIGLVDGNITIESVEGNSEVIANNSLYDNPGGLVGQFKGGSYYVNDIDLDTTINSSGGEVGGITGKLEPTSGEGAKFSNINITADIETTGEFTAGYIGWADELDSSKIRGDVKVKSTGTEVGGLIGHLNSGKLNKSHVKGYVEGDKNVGGSIGKLNSGTVANTYSSSNVNHTGDRNNFGGFVGVNYGVINKSYSTGDVDGYNAVGGFAGAVEGDINYVYAKGDVNGSSGVGGVIGELEIFDPGSLVEAYSNGTVQGNSNVGGLIGNKGTGTVSSGYWDTTSSGVSSSDGGTGLTTSEMQGSSASSNMNFDFSNKWGTNSGDYPSLSNLN